MTDQIDLLVDGGEATGGPPLGPALGPTGINISTVVDAINQKTASFKGMKVPVKVKIDAKTKEFEIEIGTPPTSALIKKEHGLEKASQDPGIEKVADLTLEQAIKVAKMKQDSLLANDVKNALKEVLGTCVSMGITATGKDAREVQKEIDEGVHEEALKAEKEEQA